MHICHMIYNIYSHAVSQVFIYLVTFLKHWQSIFLQCCSSGGLWVDVMPPRTCAVAYTQKRMICEMKIEIGPKKKKVLGSRKRKFGCTIKHPKSACLRNTQPKSRHGARELAHREGLLAPHQGQCCTICHPVRNIHIRVCVVFICIYIYIKEI